MIEHVVHPYNLQRALQHVVKNGGSAGVDGVRATELPRLFRAESATLICAIKNGTYVAQPILGVEIPKANGKKRMLGIPTVTERVFQQAVAQAITPLFEREFSDHSYGFRPHKSARIAAGKAWEYIHAGNQYIVDIDLKNFFDEVDHCLLLNLVYRKVKCKSTLMLIRKW